MHGLRQRRWARDLVCASAVASGLFGPLPAFAQSVETVVKALAAVPALQGIPLGGVAKLSQGRNAYGAKLGKNGVNATLVGTPRAGGTLAWSATFVTGELVLAKHLPPGLRSLGDLRIERAVVAIAGTDHEIQLANVPPELQAALKGLPGGSTASVHLKAGVNLLAVVRIAGSGVLADLKQHLGIATETATLRGVVGPELVRSFANAQAPPSAAPGTVDLSLELGRVAPPGLAGTLQADRVLVSFQRASKEVAAAGSATFTVSLPGGKRIAVATNLTLDNAPANKGSYFHFTGDMPPAALQGLPHAGIVSLKTLKLDVALLRSDGKRTPFFGLSGKATVGRAEVSILGTLARDAGGQTQVALWLDGEVTLADLLPGHSAPGLDHLALTQVSLDHGAISGRAQLGKAQVAVLAYLPAGKTRHNIVVGTGGIGLHDFVPAMRGTPLDTLALSSGAFFLVPKENAEKLTSARSLPPLAVQLLGGAQAVSPQKALDLRQGLNLFATLKVAASPGVKSLLEAMGGRNDALPLFGTLDPAMFNHTPWRRPGGGSAPSGGSGAASVKSFLSHLDLSVPLPPLTPPGVGQFMSLKTGTLAINGKDGGVSIGITTALELKLAERPLVIEGAFSLDRPPGGGALLKFSAKEKTRLDHPFGVKWLSLEEIDVGATIDSARRNVDLSLHAQAVVGTHRYVATTTFIEAGGKIEDVSFALKGRVPMSLIPGLGTLPGLKSVELVDPELSRTHVSGEIDLLKSKFKVALIDRSGHWDLLFQHSGFKLSELLPPLHKTMLAEVTFPKAVMIFSQSGFTRALKEFPAIIQPALAELGIAGDGNIHAEPGLSIVAAIDPAKLEGPFGKVLHKLGVHGPIVVSGGVGGVLGGAPSLNLQASLSSLPAFPVKAMRARSGRSGGTLRLSLDAQGLTVGVGSEMGFMVGRDDLTFDASVNAAISAENVVLDVQGRLDGAWHHPAGIRGLTLEDVSITLGVNETSAIVVSLGGKAKIGTNEVVLGAGASLLPEALGAPEAIAFIAQIDHLRFGDLVEAGTKFVSAAGRTLPAGDLPHHAVELHQITAALMTPGAYLDPKLLKGANLTISGTGMALAGTLVVDGRRLGSVRGEAGDLGVRLAGDLAPFHIAGVAIDKAVLDAEIAFSGAPHFTLATRARPFGALVDLDVGLDGKGFHFTFGEKVGSHYAASISARTTKGFSLSGDNDFQLHAVLGPDFLAYFPGLVRAEVEALLAEEDKALAHAEQELELARRAVQHAQTQVAEARQGAQHAAAHTVGQTEARVAQLAQRERALHSDITANYEAAKRARRNLQLREAAQLAAEGARLRAQAGGAAAELRIARAVLAAMRAGTALPAEADPRILAATVALEIARAALTVSEASVSAARAVNADLRIAADRILQPDVLEIRQAVIDGSIAKGASLTLDARIFSTRDVNIQAAYKPGDFKAVIASLGRAAGQFAAHLRGHKQNEHAPGPPPAQPAQPEKPVPAPKLQMVAFDHGRFEIPAAQCRTECRKPPTKCMAVLGPDSWYQQERPAGAGACPARPDGGCEQVVIGSRAATDPYKGCPGYRVFDTEAASMEQVEQFSACAVAGRVTGSCAKPIVIGTGWSKLALNGGTARALCSMNSCGWKIDLHEQQAGSATPTDKMIEFDKGEFRIAEAACAGQCPIPPSSCEGPWSNQKPIVGGVREDHENKPLEACPAPPQEADGTQCTQVVLGRLASVARYKGCKGYVVLNRSDWTMERNDEFIACAVSGRIGATCSKPILIASGWSGASSLAVTPASITAREMCQLRMCKWNVELNKSPAGAAWAIGR